MTDSLRDRFITRAGLSDQPSLWEIVEAVREIPYARPSERTPEGVVQDWRGTCSTKHALLVELLADRPETDIQLVHRVYRIDRKGAERQFGPSVASAVPPRGLVDVHTYATLLVDGRRVRIDVTFPGSKLWDGTSDMELACGDGDDHPAGDDPWELKDALVEGYCDPSVRELFIEALSARSSIEP